MGIRTCDDIDYICLFVGHEIGSIAIKSWDLEAPRRCFRPLRAPVADRQAPDVRQFQPRWNLEPTPETAAEDSNAQLLPKVSHFATSFNLVATWRIAFFTLVIAFAFSARPSVSRVMKRSSKNKTDRYQWRSR